MDCDHIEVTGVSSTSDVEIVGPAFAIGGSLLASERTAVADAMLDRDGAIETGIAPRKALQALLAMLSGITEGAGESPETFKNPSGTADRVTIAYDANHNRTNVTIH
jgi:hypothetical protein